MRAPRALPHRLGDAFTVRAAAQAGISAERLRRSDLRRPFPGVRALREEESSTADDTFAHQERGRRLRAAEYAPRLAPGQFFSHETAAALWHAPLPLARIDERIADGRELPVHVSVYGTRPLPRAHGVRGHRARPETSRLHWLDGLPVACAATTWASLGTLPLIELVALGDHLCRVWRPGPGRQGIGTPPLTTIPSLKAALDAGRRVGNRRLREAVGLIREDSWSPRESAVRCHLHFAGLPEPRLNHDVYDLRGRFLACVDLAYPASHVAIEYQGTLHSSRYAQDVERLAALRANGWTVIEVTASLLASPSVLTARVRAALRR